MGAVGVLHWVQLQMVGQGHQRLVAWVEGAWQEAFLGAWLQGVAPVGGTSRGVGCLREQRISESTTPAQIITPQACMLRPRLSQPRKSQWHGSGEQGIPVMGQSTWGWKALH